MNCDFHLHSTKSDGRLTPSALADKCKRRGLTHAALTDHDTVDGVAEFLSASAQLGFIGLPGIEISSYDNAEVHILVYNLDYTNSKLLEELTELKELRRVRNYAIVKKLTEFGIFVDLDQIYANAQNKTVGRPDIADKMVEQGAVDSRLQAFEEYLGFGKKAYVQSKRLSPREAISLGTRYGGIPVLAHPKNLKLPQHALIDYVVRLKEYGLLGIEADYYAHTDLERKFYKSLGDKYKLIATGGSDFHDATHGGEATFRPNKFTRKVLCID